VVSVCVQHAPCVVCYELYAMPEYLCCHLWMWSDEGQLRPTRLNPHEALKLCYSYINVAGQLHAMRPDIYTVCTYIHAKVVVLSILSSSPVDPLQEHDEVVIPANGDDMEMVQDIVRIHYTCLVV